MPEKAINRFARTVAEETGLSGTALMIETYERAAEISESEGHEPAVAYLCRMNAAVLRGQARHADDGSIEWILAEVRKPLIDEILEREAAACGAPM
jgi:hypothetical protein